MLQQQIELKNLVILGDIQPKDVDFASSLAAAKNVSEKQLYWINRLVEQAKQNAAKSFEPAESVSLNNYSRIVEYLNQPLSMIKNPSIRLLLANTEDSIRLHWAKVKEGHHNFGFIYVKKQDGTYLGKISPKGDFFPDWNLSSKPALSANVLKTLDAFVSDPFESIRAYARKEGNCCFCCLELTDERSTFFGYGEVCSTRYNLPWGNDQMEAAKNLVDNLTGGIDWRPDETTPEDFYAV